MKRLLFNIELFHVNYLRLIQEGGLLVCQHSSFWMACCTACELQIAYIMIGKACIAVMNEKIVHQRTLLNESGIGYEIPREASKDHHILHSSQLDELH